MFNRNKPISLLNARILGKELGGEILCLLRNLSPLKCLRAWDLCTFILATLSHTSAWKPAWLCSGNTFTLWIFRANFIHEFPTEICFDFFSVLHCERKKNKPKKPDPDAAAQLAFLRASPEPSLQLPASHFIITRGVRLFHRNWFGPDLQDLGKHSSGEYCT